MKQNKLGIFNKQRIFKREFNKACTQAEQIFANYEQAEYKKLQKICPILQRTTNINNAYMECLICNQHYCQTTDQQQEINQ